jgi:hypothetical protein
MKSIDGHTFLISLKEMRTLRITRTSSMLSLEIYLSRPVQENRALVRIIMFKTKKGCKILSASDRGTSSEPDQRKWLSKALDFDTD